MTPLDWLLFRRTIAAEAAALVVAAAVAAATDEATSTVPMRIARLAAFSPFIGALSALGVAAHSRSRGELRALEALGVSPSRAGTGAAGAAFCVAALAMILLATPWADVTSLLPVVLSGAEFRFDEDGFVARAAHVAVAANGRLSLLAPPVAASAGAPAAWQVLPCLVPIAALAAPWAVAPMGRGARIASLGLTGASLLALLHLVAGGRIPPLASAIAGGPLAVALAVSRLRERADANPIH